jgi:hypothetical protein
MCTTPNTNMKNALLITLLVTQASSLTWIISLEARLTDRQPTVFLHPYDTPASDTPIFIAPPPDRPARPIQRQDTEDSQLLPRIALDTEPDASLFP